MSGWLRTTHLVDGHMNAGVGRCAFGAGACRFSAARSLRSLRLTFGPETERIVTLPFPGMIRTGAENQHQIRSTSGPLHPLRSATHSNVLGRFSSARRRPIEGVATLHSTMGNPPSRPPDHRPPHAGGLVSEGLQAHPRRKRCHCLMMRCWSVSGEDVGGGPVDDVADRGLLVGIACETRRCDEGG